jgi:glycerophosphoryl diester phosphodiesterase
MKNRSLPINLAHRGARKVAPENTLAAFSAARKIGADGVELDVIRCGSGEMVVTHDDDLSVWSNGRGRVCESSLSALKELDFGSHFDQKFAGERIPTLQETVDTLGSEMFINIEIKTVSLRPIKEAQAVAALIALNNLYSRVLVSSFNPIVLREIKRLDARIPAGLLFQFRFPFYCVRQLFRTPLFELQAVHPESRLINHRLIKRARKRDYLVNTWTVNDPAKMRELVELGVNAIITDYPDRLKDVLEEYRNRDYSFLGNRRKMRRIGLQ